MNLGDMLGQTARRYGSKVAASQGDRNLTFREFDDRSNQLGRMCLELGLDPGDRVAVLLGNRLEWFDAWFGLMKAGLVRVGINHRLTADEIHHQLRDSGAKAAIVAPEFEQVVRDADVDRNCTLVTTGPGYEYTLACTSSSRLNVELDRDAPAALIYTSGTTGRPKGAVQTHGNWYAFTAGALMELGIQADDRILAAGPLTFSGGGHAYPALYRGASHVILEKFEPRDVLDAIATYRITVTTLVPTMIYMLLEELGRSPVDVSSLRTIVYGGGPIAPGKLKECLDTFGPIFIQTYGMTEIPGGATYLLKDDHVPDKPHIASAGRVAFGLECQILNDDKEKAEIGDVGEICFRGDNVAPSYWNNPEATRERFGTWFRTGDLGYIDVDGYVFLVDRRSDMIITGGHNVYPREVEDVLLSHPDVVEAAVVSVLDDKWGEAVTAVVRCKSQGRTSASDLEAHCREKLAGFKVPKSFEFEVTPLPKNPNGKLLRRELRERYRKKKSGIERSSP